MPGVELHNIDISTAASVFPVGGFRWRASRRRRRLCGGRTRMQIDRRDAPTLGRGRVYTRFRLSGRVHRWTSDSGRSGALLMKWSCGRQHDVTVYGPRPDIDLCARLLRTSVYPSRRYTRRVGLGCGVGRRQPARRNLCAPGLIPAGVSVGLVAAAAQLPSLNADVVVEGARPLPRARRRIDALRCCRTLYEFIVLYSVK